MLPYCQYEIPDRTVSACPRRLTWACLNSGCALAELHCIATPTITDPRVMPIRLYWVRNLGPIVHYFYFLYRQWLKSPCNKFNLLVLWYPLLQYQLYFVPPFRLILVYSDNSPLGQDKVQGHSFPHANLLISKNMTLEKWR